MCKPSMGLIVRPTCQEQGYRGRLQTGLTQAGLKDIYNSALALGTETE
ncbi:MAG: hypothetical protein WBP08_07260 [Saprospiraceae bacterium]|nr:hypothetical protein [Saprospiraceae bacterium]